MSQARTFRHSGSVPGAHQYDVLVLGPYPPPLGGVSRHVKRLAEALMHMEIHVGVLNHFGSRRAQAPGPPVIGELRRNPLRYWRAVRAADASIVHYHDARLSTLVAVAMARRSSPSDTFLVTLHGHRTVRHLRSRVPGLSRLVRWALEQFDELVAVSGEIAQALRASLPNATIVMIPAYLPAHEADEAGPLPDHLETLLSTAGTTLLVSAYRLAVRPRQKDIYGVDRVVELFRSLASHNPRLHLVIFLAHPPRGLTARRYLASLKRALDDAELDSRYAICVGVDLLPAFAYRVVYLRPSRIDGDAVSIREALQHDVPVIASDVVERPAGTQVLPEDDVAAWQTTVERMLLSPPRTSELAKRSARIPPDTAALLDLYTSRLRGERRLR